jgi:hypothetical protein
MQLKLIDECIPSLFCDVQRVIDLWMDTDWIPRLLWDCDAVSDIPYIIHEHPSELPDERRSLGIDVDGILYWTNEVVQYRTASQKGIYTFTPEYISFFGRRNSLAMGNPFCWFDLQFEEDRRLIFLKRVDVSVHSPISACVHREVGVNPESTSIITSEPEKPFPILEW